MKILSLKEIKTKSCDGPGLYNIDNSTSMFSIGKTHKKTTKKEVSITKYDTIIGKTF